MTVKIFIKRKVTDRFRPELDELLRKLRTLTLSQPGYISGETLTRIDKDDECIVISTWRSLEDWNNWFKNEKRVTLQTLIDQLLEKETEYAIFE